MDCIFSETVMMFVTFFKKNVSERSDKNSQVNVSLPRKTFKTYFKKWRFRNIVLLLNGKFFSAGHNKTKKQTAVKIQSVPPFTSVYSCLQLTWDAVGRKSNLFSVIHNLTSQTCSVTKTNADHSRTVSDTKKYKDFTETKREKDVYISTTVARASVLR